MNLSLLFFLPNLAEDTEGEKEISLRKSFKNRMRMSNILFFFVPVLEYYHITFGIQLNKIRMMKYGNIFKCGL